MTRSPIEMFWAAKKGTESDLLNNCRRGVCILLVVITLKLNVFLKYDSISYKIPLDVGG